MAKKGVKKKVVRKKAPVKKSSVKQVQKPEIRQVRATPSRLKLVLRNLILFVILSIISYILYIVSKGVVYETFFYFLTMILGFVSLAFLISFLVLIFLKLLRR